MLQRSEKAVSICQSQWQGREYKKIDYCGGCILYDVCVKQSPTGGAENFNNWIDTINKKAAGL